MFTIILLFCVILYFFGRLRTSSLVHESIRRQVKSSVMFYEDTKTRIHIHHSRIIGA